MKIITRCIISMKTLQVIEEESCEYSGSVAECKGGGGGGAGRADWPTYMKRIHEDWLDNTGLDTMASSIDDLMNAAIGNSPWTGQVPYDPAADITAYEAAITAFAAILAGIVDTTDWDALYAQAETSIGTSAPITSIPDVDAIADLAVADIAADGISEAEIIADIDAFADQLDDEVTTKVLPRFRSGMRDINAVVSSAFPIGEAVIEGFRDREVAKHASALRLSAEYKNADVELGVETANLGKDVEVGKANLGKDVELERLSTTIKAANADVAVSEVKASLDDKRAYIAGTGQMLGLMTQRISWESEYMKTVIEGKRIRIVANKEEQDAVMIIDEHDASWDLGVYQHGANLMASIGGGVGGKKPPSLQQSVLGGAMSGAAAGYMTTGTWQGAAVGAFMGGASAYMNY